MTAYTDPDNLPYPDDYQQPADSPSALAALANAVQAALTSIRSFAASRVIDSVNGTNVDIAPSQRAVNVALGDKSGTAHTHDSRYYTEAETNTLLGGKAATVHAHDDRYYTEAEVASLLANKVSGNVAIKATVHGPYTAQGGESLNHTVPHGLGKVPTAIFVSIMDDDGSMSIASSTGAYDATNVVASTWNTNSSAAETYRVAILAIG